MLNKRGIEFLGISLILILILATISYAQQYSSYPEGFSPDSYREDNIENIYARAIKIGIFRVPLDTDKDFIRENSDSWETWEAETLIDRDRNSEDDSGNGGVVCDLPTLQKTSDTCFAMVNKYHYCKYEGDYYATLLVEDSKGMTDKNLSESCNNGLGIFLMVLGILGVVAGIATGNPEIAIGVALLTTLISKLSHDSGEDRVDTNYDTGGEFEFTGEAVSDVTGRQTSSSDSGFSLGDLGGAGGIAGSLGALGVVIFSSKESLQGTISLPDPEQVPNYPFRVGGEQDLFELYNLNPSEVGNLLKKSGFKDSEYPAFLFSIRYDNKEMCECADYKWTGTLCDKTRNRDYDNDGVLDYSEEGQVDKCPGTPPNQLSTVDSSGCSKEQKLELGDPNDFRFEFSAAGEVSYERPKFEIGLRDGSVLPEQSFNLVVYTSEYVGDNGKCVYKNEEGNEGTFYCNSESLQEPVAGYTYKWPCSITAEFSVSEGNHEDFTITCAYEDGRSDTRYFFGESGLLIDYIWKDSSDDILDVYLNVYGTCRYWYSDIQPNNYDTSGYLSFEGICDENDDQIACNNGYYKHLRTEELLTQNRVHLICKDQLDNLMSVQTYTFIGLDE